jgi:membrane-bound lytic murein transglycosylase B
MARSAGAARASARAWVATRAAFSRLGFTPVRRLLAVLLLMAAASGPPAAGARGPMQFLPATWRAYGMGGDIDDPHDAILAAANYLHRAGDLYAYNHSAAYVHAVRRLAARMRADERTFLTYYAWQVFVRTPSGGVRRMTGPGR